MSASECAKQLVDQVVDILTQHGVEMDKIFAAQDDLLKLTSTAQEWADHLASSCQFDHRPKDSWPENARAENIISGCEFDPKGSVAVMGWKNSPGHNKNMLGDHEIMGVGFAKKRGCIKFCQISGNQDEQEATVTVAMYGVQLPNATGAGVVLET